MSVGHFYDIAPYDGDTLTCLPLEYKEHCTEYQIINNTKITKMLQISSNSISKYKIINQK